MASTESSSQCFRELIADSKKAKDKRSPLSMKNTSSSSSSKDKAIRMSLMQTSGVIKTPVVRGEVRREMAGALQVTQRRETRVVEEDKVQSARHEVTTRAGPSRITSSKNPKDKLSPLLMKDTSSSSSSPSLKDKAMPVSFTRTSGLIKGPGPSSQCFCVICAEIKEAKDMSRVNRTCSHSFCTVCISKHVAIKVQENTIAVPCPGLECRSVVDINICRQILPQDVLFRWARAMYESLNESRKYYCPYRDCSAMLVRDREKTMVRECKCPFCHRMFCSTCLVPWHAGITCREYRSLNKDERGREDLMMMELAKQKKWARCPNCKFFIERTEGCPHIICRCKFEFCYGCGVQWRDNHGGCARS